ncbi:uncharacterized protein MELLADRAFT_60616 [Melampsora larici-populina 98AG31]|uniref:Secreted protein n=1 Tax=Melampsora larici-populina (strain 98AG31 / pathotype 3-4-7) TaxID=747676 RepID=F4RBQ3_MELLP|nr:uncharacterized protein MELLADRAFT_60616 [Melampsora larici-populina 98AG31]EGG10143.1 hypothetical protein MELLADRAFT_60616 [Melampsora larici-populina 98AG31]
MNSFAPLILLASLFCKHLSAQGNVALLRNLPNQATSSASDVKSIMVNRSTFTAPEDNLIAENQIGTITVDRTRKKSKSRHREDSSRVPEKKMKIKPTGNGQGPSLIGEASATSGVLQPAPPLDAVPYSFFFQSAKKVSASTTYSLVRTLADSTQRLVSKLGTSLQPWDSWIHANEGLALECINTAHLVLHKYTLPGWNRTWVLGIVAGLVKHVTPKSTNIVNELKNPRWKNHVYLEIQAAIEFEESFTQKFQSLFSSPKLDMTNPGLEECLSRASLLKSHNDVREIYFKDKTSSTDIDKFVCNHLLDIKLPEEDKSIKAMIQSFASYFKNVEMPSWEGTYGKAILIYLMSHWQNVNGVDIDALLRWTETQFELYRDLHLPFFKAKIKKILKKPEMIESGIDFDATYHEMIDTSQDSIGHNFFKLSDNLFHFRDLEEISDSALLDRYKLMVIASLMHRPLKDLVIHSIGHTPNVIPRLVPFWLDKFPDLEGGLLSIFDYKHMPFRTCPYYFASAHRDLLPVYMMDYPATEYLGVYLENITPLLPQLDPSLVKTLLSMVKTILITHEDHDEIPKVYLMVLEVIDHVVRYSPGSAEIFLRQLYEDAEYRQIMYKRVVEVLDSGIFAGTITETKECVMQYHIHTFFSILREMTSPYTVWEFEDLSKGEEHIKKFAISLEKHVAPYSRYKIDDLPDPRAYYPSINK